MKFDEAKIPKLMESTWSLRMFVEEFFDQIFALKLFKPCKIQPWPSQLKSVWKDHFLLQKYQLFEPWAKPLFMKAKASLAILHHGFWINRHLSGWMRRDNFRILLVTSLLTCASNATNLGWSNRFHLPVNRSIWVCPVNRSIWVCSNLK